MEPTISEFTIMFSIATIGMLVLALAIVFFVIFYQKKMLQSKLEQQRLEVEYQQKMLLSALESQESERQRLAGDLHDGIGAMLSTIRLSVLTIARSENLNTEGLQQTKKMIDDTIDSVRRISRDLMPSTLEKLGVSQTIHEMCDQYAAVSGLKIEFEQQGNERHFDKSKEVMLFRIVQELVNNAIKHSEGSYIQVLLNWSERLWVSVEDDGVGFNVEEKKQSAGGIGLFNMQNRVKMLNASLEYELHRTKGTKATLIIPLA
jgi:two-component system NarL family sensor kinase